MNKKPCASMLKVRYFRLIKQKLSNKFMKSIITLLLFIISASLFAQKGYRIEGKIKDLNGGECILANYYAAQIYAKDTAKADANGYFVFKGDTPLAGGVYEVVLPNRRTLYRLIIADDQEFSFTADTTDVVGSVKVKGSVDNELFYSFQQAMKANEDEYKKLKQQNVPEADLRLKKIQEQRKQYYDDFMKKNADTFVVKVFKTAAEPDVPPAPKHADGKIDSTWVFNYYKKHYWDNFDFADDRLLQTPFLHQKLERYFKDLTLQTEDSLIKEADYVVAKALAGKQKDIIQYTIFYITNQYENPKIVGTEGVFVHMAEKYYLTRIMPLSDTSTLKNVADRVKVLKPLLINKVIPDLGVLSDKGKDHLVYIQEFKTDYEVVFFYSPTCGHCREAAPKLKAFHDKFRPQGIEVMTIAVDGTEDDWRKFIKEFKWENLVNGFGGVVSRSVVYRNDYDTYSTPTIYIVDKNKKIIARRIGVEDLEPFLNMYRKKLQKENPKKS